MIAGVGVDVVAIDRLGRRLEGDRGFLAAFLTPAEGAVVEASAAPAEVAARLFAAKEAIVKLLRVDGSDGLLLKDIELAGPAGAPRARLVGRARVAARAAGVERVLVATCAAGGKALAVAAAERPAGEKERA